MLMQFKTGDGSISQEELGDVLKSMNLQKPPTDVEIEDLFKQFDRDNSGSIDFDEFVALFGKISSKQLTLIFKILK